MKPDVVTVDVRSRRAEEGEGPIRLLALSCRRNGFRLSVLGTGERWGGYGTKLCLLRRHLRKAPDRRPILFLDAYDTVLLPCRDRIMESFLSFGVPLVFGAEAGCWPDPDLASWYPEPDPGPRSEDRRITAFRPPPPPRGPFRYLNSGVYLGLAGAIREALEELDPSPGDDDQRLYTRYFLEHGDRVRLDVRAQLFQNLYRVRPEDLCLEEDRPVRLRSRWTGTQPCVLHGNGPGRETFLHVTRRLEEVGWP